ncbi:MFS transporter [Streptomyces rectiverticillatus]|uniref:MFS transporter n=1 Tax=Streptomyces rectiverticillatus TaxID=173860 RepID=UPI0015C33F24|nr:MFS transporter [Streptomyces rectiverticillatus]QLE75117.1 MFS transporter [Streptomyces rectiverticillatus]
MSLQTEPSPWRDSRFRVFAAGNLANNLGEGMYGFALPLLVLSYTGSLATMALLVAVSPLVITVAGPFLGHVVDRYGSRVLVVPGLLLQLCASLALNFVLLGGPAPVWSLYVAEALVQIGAVSYRAGWLAGIPAMFPDSTGRSRGSLTVLFQTSLILGPALASLLVGPLGYTGLLWLNSATFLAPLVVWFLGVNPVAGQKRYQSAPVSFVESLRAGLRIFSRGEKMGTLLLLMVPASFTFSTGTTALFVFLARDALDASPSSIGVALAVANVGGLTGALITAEIPRWKIRTVTVLGLASAGGGLLLIASGVGLVAATAALTLFFICENVIAVATEMEMFSSVPPELIGRATGMWRLATGLPTAAAPSVIAFLGGFLGPRAIFVVLAVVAVVPLAWLLGHRSALRYEHPASGDPGRPEEDNRGTRGGSVSRRS